MSNINQENIGYYSCLYAHGYNEIGKKKLFISILATCHQKNKRQQGPKKLR